VNVELFQSLMQRAGNADAAGFVDLAIAAVQSGNSGEMPWAHSLAHAMFWARLGAATRPDAANLTSLAQVLIAYANDARQRISSAQGDHLGAQAIFRLEQAAQLGDEDAASLLSVAAESLSPAASSLAAQWQTNGRADDIAVEDACLKSAAAGDPQAIADVFDTALNTAYQNIAQEEDAMALLHVISVFGCATGNPQLTLRYAGMLISLAAHRGCVERSEQDRCHLAAEGLRILAELACGDAGAGKYLQGVLAFVPLQAVSLAAVDRPELLAFVAVAGSC